MTLGSTSVAAIVSAALVRLTIVRPILIGHSLGAQPALKLAASGRVQSWATILIDMSPEDNDQADAAVAEHIDALIAGAADLEGLSDKVHARLPLGDSDAIREAVTAMARAMDCGWRVPLDPAIKALLHSSDEGDGDWALLKVLPRPVGIVRGARAALAQLGYTALPILRAMDRRPQWPTGFVGAITHSVCPCAAIAARSQDFHGLGIDLETDTPLNPDIRHLVCRPEATTAAWSGSFAAGSTDRAKRVFAIRVNAVSDGSSPWRAPVFSW